MTMRVALGRVQVFVEKRTALLALALCLAAAALAVYSVASGTINYSLAEVMSALALRGEDKTELVIWSIRLPRAVAAIAVGMALGAAGSVFQSISRNALGSPDVIGFTTGAATGAVLQIVLYNKGATATALSAVAFGVVTAVIVYLLSRNRGSTGGYRLVLIGIGVSAMLSALNTLLLAWGDLDLAVKARIWLSGSLNAREWNDVYPALIALAICLPMLIYYSRPLNILEMGDDQAKQLGVNTERLRLIVMILGVLLTSVAVAAAGPIAFIALAAPQIVSRITGAARVQVVCSGLFGAVLLLAADMISRNLPTSYAVPVGLTTGVIGGFYLLWILTRQKAV
ncbi:MAG: iron chelate uptake ABC transporter family permease subunit [Corynebacterium glutamicum]|uniref:FecCD family ABC transporter permease n=1 Tax=Corynebacterium glutamicum TaxID=1718 RepID=UPI00097F60DB|nr:iron chelate uptake ABC transporter family permease subunit [Corynebacterium glutamicum]MDO5371824.1 iron chelate uptake ABC transporter family permease subunit [Corynebacterium glutamicum]SJM50674.1 ABC-type transporter, permease component [Corynebacterium glutamicum]